MVFTDPPYNVPIDGHASGLGKLHHRDFAMASGEMTSGQFIDFLAANFHLLAQHSAEGSLHSATFSIIQSANPSRSAILASSRPTQARPAPRNRPSGCGR